MEEYHFPEAVNEHRARECKECERIEDIQAIEASVLRNTFFPFKVTTVVKYLSKGRKIDLVVGKRITNGLSQLMTFTTLSFIFILTHWKRPHFVV